LHLLETHSLPQYHLNINVCRTSVDEELDQFQPSCSERSIGLPRLNVVQAWATCNRPRYEMSRCKHNLHAILQFIYFLHFVSHLYHDMYCTATASCDIADSSFSSLFFGLLALFYCKAHLFAFRCTMRVRTTFFSERVVTPASVDFK